MSLIRKSWNRYAFGEMYANSGGGTAAFTGMTSDTVTPSSNVYDFLAREYGPQGRWPTPDPAGMAAVDPTNPQTWNRYAYVGNNPLAYVDPSGMNECAPNNSASPAANQPSCFKGAAGTMMPGEYPVSFYFGSSPVPTAFYPSSISAIGNVTSTVANEPLGIGGNDGNSISINTPIFGYPSYGYSNPLGVTNAFGMFGGISRSVSTGWKATTGKTITFKPPYSDTSRPDCAAVWAEGFAEGVEAASYPKDYIAPPGQGSEDAAASATKAAATWVLANYGVTTAYGVLTGVAEAVEAWPLAQLALGTTGGLVKMSNTKFLQHGCVSPLDF